MTTLNVFITIDTEIMYEYHESDDIDKSYNISVLGGSYSENYGLNYIINTLNNYGLKGSFFVEPRITFSYLDSNHVDYYYGVGKEEVNVNRTEYVGESALNTGIGISMSTPIFLGGYTQINIQRTWFDSVITDSPLVEDHSNLIIRLLYTRTF